MQRKPSRANVFFGHDFYQIYQDRYKLANVSISLSVPVARLETREGDDQSTAVTVADTREK